MHCERKGKTGEAWERGYPNTALALEQMVIIYRPRPNVMLEPGLLSYTEVSQVCLTVSSCNVRRVS